MKTNRKRTWMAGLVAVAVIIAGANAFAGKGQASRNDGQGCDGYGQNYHDNGCGPGAQNPNLTPEQREQMKTERQAFFNATRQSRQDLYAKRLALKAEIAKSEPDMKIASDIQKEVSELQANLDQKRLEHIMAMRKINPDAGRGFYMDGRGMGRHGMGHGQNRGKCRGQSRE